MSQLQLGIIRLLSRSLLFFLLAGIVTSSGMARDINQEDAEWHSKVAAICWKLCHFGPGCPNSCPESFLGSWAKRSIDGRHALSLDDYEWFMKLLGRNMK